MASPMTTLLTLTGTAEANSQVQLYDGSLWLGSVTTDANGGWTFTTQALPDGGSQYYGDGDRQCR